MAKAVVTITSAIFWDSTDGFSFGIRYGLENQNFSSQALVVKLGVSNTPSQPDTVLKAIRDAVISDASSSFSVTLSLDDVIVV